jgi:DNA-binding CsgD family transcriptional regulator
MLLEREQPLALLQGALDEAVRPRGQVALVSGEAGIGKTTLVEAFARRQRGVRVLRGACEALFTPRPLGPLRDIAVELGGPLLEVLDQGSRERIFDACLAALARPDRPTLCIIEDLHWADEATLDLLKFLARRIGKAPVVLVATYRDDEVTAVPTLRRVLGDLPPSSVLRIELGPLSEAGVAALARKAGRNPDGLHALTSGNPFFLTELLGDEGASMPSSVAAAVQARVARLSPAARELLELVAVVPGACEVWLLQAMRGATPDGLAESLDGGLLTHRLGAYAFRHELARLAVLDAVPAGRRQQLNALVMRTLLGRDARQYAGRVVHHAAEAGAADVVLQHAPPAAAYAARVGAHREAAAYYGRALEYAEALPLEERARLLELRSFECYLTDQHDAAFEARERALQAWRQLDQPIRIGDSLRWLSRLAWCRGQQEAAGRFAGEALQALVSLPPSRELAYAHSNCAQLAMLAHETSACIEHGRKALELARRLGDVEVEVHALNNIGTATWGGLRDPAGREMLERSLALAVEHGFQEHAARAYTNLAYEAGIGFDFDAAARYYEAGIAYCEAGELDFWGQYMRACRTQVWLDQGRWREAEAEARALLELDELAPISRILALAVLARILARTGAGRTARLLDEAVELAQRSGDLIRLTPVACARAEAAWLAGQPEHIREIVEPVYRQARVLGDYDCGGELAWWMGRTGALETREFEVHPAWALQGAGRYADAAEAWRALGCPYHEAVARLEAGDARNVAAALAIFERLGARVPAQQARARLRPQSAPRRRGAGGLTRRQAEVLALAAEGLSNAGIAARLFLSPKTVDHHLQAAFGVLGANSRTEAVAEARRKGWLADPGGVPPGEDGEISR